MTRGIGSVTDHKLGAEHFELIPSTSKHMFGTYHIVPSRQRVLGLPGGESGGNRSRGERVHTKYLRVDRERAQRNRVMSEET